MMSDADGFPVTTEDYRHDRRNLAIGVAVIICFAFAALPSTYAPLGPPGIDPGWGWAVNQAAEAGHVFGRDIAFTYGPLGWMMSPMDISSNLLIANSFFLLLQAVLAATLVALFLSQRRLLPMVAFSLLYLSARQLGLLIEAHFVLLVGLLCVASIILSSRLAFAVAAGIAAVLFLIKMSLGVAALAALCASLLVAVFIFRRPYTLALGFWPFPIVLASLSIIFFDSAGTFFRWLHLSFEVVSGYSIANSILGPNDQTAIGMFAVGAWLGAAAALRTQRALLAANLVLAPVVVIQFRLAFVRQDTHQLQFIPFVLAALAVSALFAKRPRQLLWHAITAIMLLIAGGLTGLVTPTALGNLPLHLLKGGWGRLAVSRLIHLDATRAELAERSERQLEPLVLEEGWLDLLRNSENGVGTIPWEIQYCPANDLPWNPTPTLQLYSSCTEELDNWNARHYAGDRAPQYIINQYSAVGKRRQLFDAPATWRTIFVNYRLRSVHMQQKPLLLLERRPKTPAISYEALGRGRLVAEGPGLAVPFSDQLLFAHVDLRLNAIGRLQKTLFRVPLVFLMMTHASGAVNACRIIPGTAGNGILINAYPRDDMGYIGLWRKTPRDPVVRCTLTGPGTPLFQPEAEVIWRELQFLAPSRPSPTDPPLMARPETTPGSGESP